MRDQAPALEAVSFDEYWGLQKSLKAAEGKVGRRCRRQITAIF